MARTWKKKNTYRILAGKPQNTKYNYDRGGEVENNIVHYISVIHSYTLSCIASTYHTLDFTNHQNMDTHLKQKETIQYNKHFTSSGLSYCYYKHAD